MRRLLRILHVLNHSLPVVDGYAVRSANIVYAQRRLGWEPVVVTSPRHVVEASDAVEERDGVRYYRSGGLAGATGCGGLARGSVVCRFAARLCRILARERPDVVHAHSPAWWAIGAWLAAQRMQLPLVYEVRGLWEEAAVVMGTIRRRSFGYGLRRCMDTWVARRADALVGISERLRDEFQARAPSTPCFVVPNGIDVGHVFRRSASAGALREGLRIGGHPVVGYIGTLAKWEGVELLLDAAAILQEQGRMACFLVVGGGDQEATLRRRCSALKLDQNVRFTGPVPRDCIGDYYALCDVLVYPRPRNRQNELVTPLKPLEAAAVGKAVVISDVGGLTELFPEGTALRFRAGDARALAEACCKLLEDSGLRGRLGRAAEQHVRSRHSWGQLVELYMEVYATALRRRLRADRVLARLATGGRFVRAALSPPQGRIRDSGVEGKVSGSQCSLAPTEEG